MNLASLVAPEAILPRLVARDKKHALKLMAARAAKLTPLAEREIYTVLLEREQISCTGMGNSVCIPHGRFEHLDRLYAVFASMEKPIEFGAADGKPVDLIFMLLTPMAANTEHLKALAIMSRLLRDKSLCQALRKAPDAHTLHALLTSEREDG